MKALTRGEAATWASWFQALGEPTRLLILHLLATACRPMTVGEIVESLDVSQSTVSHHLAKLAEVRFVLVERSGTSSRWEINRQCLAALPTAAELLLGRIPAQR